MIPACLLNDPLTKIVILRLPNSNITTPVVAYFCPGKETVVCRFLLAKIGSAEDIDTVTLEWTVQNDETIDEKRRMWGITLRKQTKKSTRSENSEELEAGNHGDDGKRLWQKDMFKISDNNELEPGVEIVLG